MVRWFFEFVMEVEALTFKSIHTMTSGGHCDTWDWVAESRIATRALPFSDEVPFASSRTSFQIVCARHLVTRTRQPQLGKQGSECACCYQLTTERERALFKLSLFKFRCSGCQWRAACDTRLSEACRLSYAVLSRRL